jgi:hypothetical protein
MYTGLPVWVEHGFGVVSVLDSISVISVLDVGCETMVGFVNGWRGSGFSIVLLSKQD